MAESTPRNHARDVTWSGRSVLSSSIVCRWFFVPDLFVFFSSFQSLKMSKAGFAAAPTVRDTSAQAIGLGQQG